MSESEKIPVGPELDAAIAVALFGWQWWWYPVPGRCAIQPPETEMRVNFPADAKLFDGVPPIGLRFADWENMLEPVQWIGMASHRLSARFSTDIAATERAIEAMYRRRYLLTLHEYFGGGDVPDDTGLTIDFGIRWIAQFHGPDQKEYAGDGLTISAAVAHAIWDALEAEKKGGA